MCYFLHIVPTNKKLKNMIAQNLNEIAFANKSNFKINLIVFDILLESFS